MESISRRNKKGEVFASPFFGSVRNPMLDLTSQDNRDDKAIES
jgi:hypothetical protein